MPIKAILLVAAAVCFLLAAFNVVAPRINLTALGLFLLTIGEFFPK
jgi:hypothetical protein